MQRKKSIALVLMTIAALSGFGGPVSAEEKTIPFRGWVNAQETNEVMPPNLIVDGKSTGLSTRLGPFRFEFHVTVDLATGGGPATATFFAANGDRFFAEGQGQGTSVGELASIVETFTVTGGTGWFRGASGNITVIRLVTLATGASIGALDGYIVK